MHIDCLLYENIAQAVLFIACYYKLCNIVTHVVFALHFSSMKCSFRPLYFNANHSKAIAFHVSDTVQSTQQNELLVDSCKDIAS